MKQKKINDGFNSLITQNTFSSIDSANISNYMQNNNQYSSISSIPSYIKDMYEYTVSTPQIVLENMYTENPNIRDSDDSFPLIKASSNNNRYMVENMLSNDGNPNVYDNNGNNALMYAIENGNVDIVKLLIDKGVYIEKPFRFSSSNIDSELNGRTPLNYAIFKNNKDVVKLLIKAGADVNKEDDKGYTPLVYAKLNKNKEIIDILEKSGAKKDITLDKAINIQNKDVVELLIKEGVDLNRENENGYTPLDIAIQNDYKICVMSSSYEILEFVKDITNNDPRIHIILPRINTETSRLSDEDIKIVNGNCKIIVINNIHDVMDYTGSRRSYLSRYRYAIEKSTKKIQIYLF